MTLGLANRCNWLQVYKTFIYLMVYQISNVCLALMYIKHKHMVCGKLHRYHYLVLDQNASDNAYSVPLRHEVWNVDHKMVILGIDLCYNTFSHILCNTIIILNMILSICTFYFHKSFIVFSLIKNTIFAMLFC